MDRSSQLRQGGERRMSIRDKTTADAEAKRPRVSRPTGSTAVHHREGVATDPRDLVRFSIPEFEYRPLGGAPSLRWPHSGWIAHPLPAGELTPANMIMLEFLHRAIDRRQPPKSPPAARGRRRQRTA